MRRSLKLNRQRTSSRMGNGVQSFGNSTDGGGGTYSSSQTRSRYIRYAVNMYVCIFEFLMYVNLNVACDFVLDNVEKVIHI